jgi:hypothetical protein
MALLMMVYVLVGCSLMDLITPVSCIMLRGSPVLTYPRSSTGAEGGGQVQEVKGGDAQVR